MAENRDFAWLRKTLCDEIEAVRSGKADHARAKSVAALAATALKSVEVEAMVRQQQTDLIGTDVAQLGSIALCAPVEPASALSGDQEGPDEESDAAGDDHISQPEKVVERAAPIRSPIVPPGARFVAGRAESGSR